MIHKNWAELIKPLQLEVKPGNEPARQATIVAEPLERGFGLDYGERSTSSADELVTGCCYFVSTNR